MICHHYKCIFVHIPKCGGQSIEHVFIDSLGLDWDTRAPLLLRPNDKPELGPPRLAHLKAGDYVKYKYLTQEMFDEYFKFAFVRNPWSRMVSLYRYSRFGKELPFKPFLFDVFEGEYFEKNRWFAGPQSEFVYSEDDCLMVDYIGRLESVESDFRTICGEIGLPFSGVPHMNRSPDPDFLSGSRLEQEAKLLPESINQKHILSFDRYQDYYDQESADLVARFYERDIELFGYSF